MNSPGNGTGVGVEIAIASGWKPFSNQEARGLVIPDADGDCDPDSDPDIEDELRLNEELFASRAGCSTAC